MVAGILIGHGEFPIALYNTVKKIIGEQEHFRVVSNENCSSEELKRRLLLAIEELSSDNIIIFADLFGGSCGIASRQIFQMITKNVGVICGVNLGMLIKYFQYREEYELSRLLSLLAESGKKEILIFTSDNTKKNNK
ncbi:MAG: hypothetical protein NZ601_02195 [candidate division WOR-3 bacterium]|nr:hypothetical protein [candidate division WOR-3 bacterium]MCX7757540.1 hypothetical protein [candidate division WOR-3 bacterium]MDW7987639.1 hypothetical protein [candidate division WOR-3 bacterium]